MRTDALSKDDYIVGGVALLLVIDLLFLPWYSIGFYSASATSAPDSWTGILAMLAAILVLADLLVERLSPQTTLPNLGGSRTATRFRIAVIAAFFVALKFIFHIHYSLSDGGFGFWAAIVLTAGLVYATLRLSQDKVILDSATGSGGGV
jgi:hypothetical protein